MVKFVNYIFLSARFRQLGHKQEILLEMIVRNWTKRIIINKAFSSLTTSHYLSESSVTESQVFAVEVAV